MKLMSESLNANSSIESATAGSSRRSSVIPVIDLSAIYYYLSGLSFGILALHKSEEERFVVWSMFFEDTP